jgi:tetratricopeptide (TPR) repeat protein
MKIPALALFVFACLSANAQQAMEPMEHQARPAAAGSGSVKTEQLGTVNFPVTCAPASQAPFNRGVALLHDFWYEEADPQFAAIIKADPGCAMAHWGLVMSSFHEIWDRPDEAARAKGWDELQKAQALGAKTPRENSYIEALSEFYLPGKAAYSERISRYSAAMGKLYAAYPQEVDAGAFYALSLLAATAPDDTSLTMNRKAMAVLTPLVARYPDNPGLVHYIIHACDNPAMAAQGLAAADHYGEIAPSGPHAFHMPGHIYARLGLWPQDIASQLGSIAASQSAESHGESGIMDEPHSYDFLLYAYLQSGQDAKAQALLEQSGAALSRIESMPGMGANYMRGMVPYYRSKLPVFYALEMRDWKTASALEPPPDAPPQVSTMAVWARAVAHGHLRQGEAAVADLDRYHALLDAVRKGKNAYQAASTSQKIEEEEIVAWVHFAQGEQQGALEHMRAAADLQDKVGQREVDIPAREMLADMLLESHQAREALAEYQKALVMSPNRFNGLYHAGLAAEEAGDRVAAAHFYSSLLKSTANGAHSSRQELVHAKTFASSTQQSAGADFAQ